MPFFPTKSSTWVMKGQDKQLAKRFQLTWFNTRDHQISKQKEDTRDRSHEQKHRRGQDRRDGPWGLAYAWERGEWEEEQARRSEAPRIWWELLSSSSPSQFLKDRLTTPSERSFPFLPIAICDSILGISFSFFCFRWRDFLLFFTFISFLSAKKKLFKITKFCKFTFWVSTILSS